MLRLFVAIYPPPESAAALLAATPGGWSVHRPTPADQVHMTLFFIGDTATRDARAVTESIERSVAGVPAFALTPRRLVTLPEAGEPRLIAVTTDEPPPLLEVQRRLAHRLVRRAGRAKGGRFLPHFTVCRAAHGVPAERVDEPVTAGPFGVTEVRLMSSVLTPVGARHEALGRFGLLG